MINIKMYMLDFCMKCKSVDMDGENIGCKLNSGSAIDKSRIAGCLDNDEYEALEESGV